MNRKQLKPTVLPPIPLNWWVSQSFSVLCWT